MNIHRTPSGRKYRIRYIGTGQTNPEIMRPSMIFLKDYLDNGFEYGEDTELDKKLHDGELHWENEWRKENKC